MNTEQLKTDRTKEEILESLLALNSHMPVHGNEVILFNQTKQRALEAMQIFASQESKIAVEKDRESRWISVKERLPEEGKEVLVWSDRYGRTFAALTGQNKHGSIWLYSGDPIVTFNAPSHWQPLPESPKTLNL